MNLNLNIIKLFEGFRPAPYKDPASKNGLPITIGYGSTKNLYGKSFLLSDPVITLEQAETLLLAHINREILPILRAVVHSELNDNQWSAIVSFCYNLGMGNFQSSTLLKKINKDPNDPTIKEEFLKWNKAAGHVMAGLTRRREAESKLYFS